MNSGVTPQFTEGPVNADFSGVLQVKYSQGFLNPLNDTEPLSLKDMSSLPE